MGFTLDFIAADADLVPWALGVSILRADGAQEVRFSVPAHVLAIGTVVMSGDLWRVDQHGRQTLMPQCFAIGSATKAQAYIGSHQLVTASLLCMANVLPWLTGSSATAFVDRFAAPDALGRVDLAGLDPAGSAGQIAASLLGALRHCLASARPPASALAFLTTLQQWDGQSLVPSGWHARRWQRACQQQLGLTPKLLQRMVRLHLSARDSCAVPAPTSWAEHALGAGYSDQSHMLRDYRQLAGLTPVRASSTPGGQDLQILKVSSHVLLPRVLSGLSPLSDLSNP